MLRLLSIEPRFKALLLAAWTTCCQGPGPGRAPTPEQRFVAHQVQLTELRAQGVIWSATLARATGDLETTAVEEVVLTRPAENPEQPDIVLKAPRGVLSFADGIATFEPVTIHYGADTEVNADKARYVEAEQRVFVSGPVQLAGPGLTARATSAVLHFDTKRIDLAGPVRGRWAPPAPQDHR